MENKKIQKVSGRNPDVAALGNPKVAAQVDITTNEDEIRNGDGRDVPAPYKNTNRSIVTGRLRNE
ncbi:hypothetical protein [Bacillus sp. T33-2]|uniref:hypothetical protein n=1 Tax=Bacillus sp. T33-2 TaxID=2054168 RepID=UPI000C78B97B|nr:hypothetical protein [Bacillus sp. T33-2]PLR89829.1 hypothetical protein CVD19_23395 [Bacillus sp. T33-2]